MSVHQARKLARIAAILALAGWLTCGYVSFEMVIATGQTAAGSLQWWIVLYATVLVAIAGGVWMAAATRSAVRGLATHA